ncbi:MAG: hypothetical protein AAFX53_02755 [Bacteroidota bacterium]
MKKLGCAIALLIGFACADEKSETEKEKIIAELKGYEAAQVEETGTKQFIEAYIKDLNSQEWKSKIIKYLEPDPAQFLEEHSAFRTSFQNYSATIKHLTVNSNEAILWLNITANYASTYTFGGGDYTDSVLKGIEAKNQPLSWEEVWYFNVTDGKFGDQWDFLKDQYAVLRGMGALERP